MARTRMMKNINSVTGSAFTYFTSHLHRSGHIVKTLNLIRRSV